MVGGYPEISLLVGFDTTDAVISQSGNKDPVCLVARLHVITLKTVVGTYIQVTVELA